MKVGKPDPDALEYVNSHLNPMILEHVKMRALGFQVFIAIQGGLMIAFMQSPAEKRAYEWMPIALGLVSCLAFFLWDKRNRYIFETFHKIGKTLVEEPLFGVGKTSLIKGVHSTIAQLHDEHTWYPRTFRDFFSHTWSIKIMIIACSVGWSILGFNFLWSLRSLLYRWLCI